MRVAPSQPQRPLLERGWRYAIVGGVCAFTNYLIMLLIDRLGGHYLVGMLTTYLIVTPMAYALHSMFTFAEPFCNRAFIRFAGTVLASYPIATLLMIILCSGLRFGVGVAYPIAVVGMFAWNFATAHWAIFSRFDLTHFEISERAQSMPADATGNDS